MDSDSEDEWREAIKDVLCNKGGRHQRLEALRIAGTPKPVRCFLAETLMEDYLFGYI